MSAFRPSELEYLEERRLGRIATADSTARPQVTPVGMWRYNPETDTIDVTGRDFAHTRKFRNVSENAWAAFVVDDVASVDPWRPRAVVVEGPAEAIPSSDDSTDGVIRIRPDTVISWGLPTLGR